MADPSLTLRLRQIALHIQSIAAGDFDASLPITSSADEVDAIAVSLNMLAEDLSEERARRNVLEERLRDALDAYEEAPAMFCSVDVATGRIVQCNSGMASRLGLLRSQLVGLRLSSLYAPGAATMADAALRSLGAGRALREGDHLLRAADGSNVHTHVSGSVAHDARGRPSRLRLIYLDVTEQRELEAQLVHAQKMEEVGRLAGGLAHDFNNLLTVIFCAGQALELEVRSGTAADDLRQILEAAETAAELTTQLLAYSRRAVVSPEAVDVAQLFARVERMVRRILGPHTRMEVDVEPGLSPVWADAGRLEQVLLNLIRNADDAMPEGGRLVLTARADSTPGRIRIAVSDTGTGMPPEVVAQMFEPFFTTKQVGRGTGLGLAVVHGIVHQAGGRIDVESEPGRGTTVRLNLPVAAEEPAPSPGRSQTPIEEPADGSVLVVEDHPALRALLRRTLEGAGFEVVVATDGRDALDRVHAGVEPDLIVTDLVMPRMGGRDLVSSLRERGLQAPVLFITGYAGHADLPSLGDGDRAALLHKPFTPSALLGRIRVLLDGWQRH